MKYKKQNEVWIGHCNFGIVDIIEKNIKNFINLYLFITYLDSCKTNDCDNWKNYLKKRSISHCNYVYGTLIYPDGVENLFVDQKTFFGFDEIYFSKIKINENFIPSDHYTSDKYNFGKEVPTSLFEHLKESGALGLMADGIGLNFATTDENIFQQICNANNSKN